MTAAPSFVTVPFKGSRSGIFPFTWGQHWVWQSVVGRAPHFADLSGSYVVELPIGCTVSEVVAALQSILEQYETFRSQYTVDLEGIPRQVVLAEGQLRVELRDTAEAHARATAEAVEVEFNELPFTLPELGLRAAVIVADGSPRFAVLCVFHLAMDCHGVPFVLDHFLCVLNGHAAAQAGSEVRHPVDRALDEQGDQGVRRSKHGVEFWAHEVAKFPATPLPDNGRRPDNPRYQTFEMRSPAACAASALLAEELRVSIPSVVMAAAASVLAKMSGNPVCGIVLAANHRYDPESISYPGTLVQGVPVAVEVAGVSSHELVLRCHRAQMLSALSGHCHPGDVVDMLRASYGVEGTKARLACVANLDISAAPESGSGQRATRTGVERLLAESQFCFTGGTPVENEKFYLTARGSAADFAVAVRADTAVLSPSEIVDFLRELELFLINSTTHTGENS